MRQSDKKKKKKKKKKRLSSTMKLAKVRKMLFFTFFWLSSGFEKDIY